MSDESEASDRVAATVHAFTAAIESTRRWLSEDGRVGEVDAASLMGMAASTLANRRMAGTAPPHYRIGGGGHRVSYRLIDLAKFIEFLRET